MRLLLIMIALFSSNVFAQTYEKSGFPCVGEICIGDGIEELKKVQWQEVNIKKTKLSKYDTDLVNKKFKPSNHDATIYLALKVFDNTALNGLQKIKAECDDSTFMKGLYKTKSGNETEVGVKLIQAEEGAPTQTWTVVYIRRLISESSDSAIKSARLELDSRYKKFNVEDEKGYRRTNTKEKATYEFASFSGHFNFTLLHKRLNAKNQTAPECITKSNID